MKIRILLFLLLFSGWKMTTAQVSFTTNVTNGCVPLTVNFTNTSTLPANTYYEWNFGNGPAQSSFHASYTYQWTGMFNVQLQAYDTTGGAMTFLGSYNLPGGITPSGSPLYFTSDTICPNESVEMYLYPYGTNTSWDFGDGNTSTQNQPEHSWSTTGNYTVTVTSNTSCGAQTTTHTFVVMNNAQPNASFSSSSSICPNDPLQFWPQNYQAQDYQWDFGDGNTSTDTQPSHSWSTAGTYPVTLTLTSQCGTIDSYTYNVQVQNNISIGNWAQIFTSTNTACPNDLIQFDYSMNEMSVILWDFDNGDTSSEKNPQYAFSTPGTYTVSLYLMNGCGNDTTIYTTMNIITNAPFSGNPQMEFYPNPVCAGDPVNFYANSINDYLWNFGDASSSTDPQPQHTYASNGNYIVQLTLTNGCGNDTTLVDTLLVNNSVTPQLSNSGNNSNWGMPNTNICPGDTTVFYAMGGSSYLWDFGDGNTSTQTSPITVTDGNNSFVVDVTQHAYATAGTYTVYLTMYNSCGNSATDSMTITVGGSQPANPEFTITNSPIVACAPVNFLSFGGTSYDWDYGDGNTETTSSGNVSHTYLQPGTYTITMNLTNGCGNTGSISQTITVDGISATTSITNANCYNAANGSVTVNTSGGTAPYLYSIDGSATQSGTMFNGLLSGTHTIEITDNNGCVLSLPVNITSPSIIDVTISSTNSNCGSNDGTANVVATGGTGGYTYQWSTGGNNATENNLAAGTYTLTATDANACSVTETFSVNDNGGPIVTFAALADRCSNEAGFSLTGGSPVGGTYTGQGVSGGQFDPALAGAGTHTIFYTVTQTGCTASASQTITVHPAPVVNYTVVLEDVCIDATPLTLSGGFPSGGTYSGTGVSGGSFNPVTAGSGTHTIMYSYTDANNCNNTASNSIEVIDVDFSNSFSPMCIDASPLVLSGGSPAGGMYSGPGVTAGSFDPAQAGSGNALISYTYTSGNCTMSKTQIITVNGLPNVTFDTMIPMICIYDGTIVLTGETPSGGTFSGNGVSGNNFSPATAGLGNHTIIYSFTDTNSCSNSDTISIVVDQCLGMNEEDDLTALAYPNPFTDYTMITVSEIKPGMTLYIHDVIGNEVYSVSIRENKTLLPKGNLPAGVYFFTISDTQEKYATGKLIIE